MTTIDPTERDETILDIGKKCSICRRIDYLPFTCHTCSTSFCKEHRMEYIEHDSKAHKKKDTSTTSVSTAHLPPSSTVFPNLQEIRRKQAELESKSRNSKLFDSSVSNNNKTTSIASKLVNGSISQTNSNAAQALRKLKKFIKLTKKKSTPPSSNGFGFKKLTSSKKKQSPASRLIEVSKLKQRAKGDLKISASERVYIYCQYIGDDYESAFAEASGTNSNLIKHELFVSKSWPVGRMLDYCCDYLKIKNENNKTTDINEKLTIFRLRREDEKTKDESVDDEEFIYVPANGRVVKEIRDGDLIYVVKGISL